MTKKRVEAQAHSSSANLGPGFDVFAVALAQPYDRVQATLEPSTRFEVKITNSGVGQIPSEPKRNSAGAVAHSIAVKHRLKGKVHLKVVKGVPVGVGLGSSGASSAAAALAMDELFGLGMSLGAMVTHAGEGERAASGAAHLDNVSASLAGGFVLRPWGQGAEPVSMETKSLLLVIATPEVKLPSHKTAYARSLLPDRVSLDDAIHNVMGASMIVAGFARSDADLIGRGMDDVIVEPRRKRMIPGYERVKRAAKAEGALGTCISGAGPSMLSLVDDDTARARRVLEAMVDGFKAGGAAASGFVTEPGRGARVVASR